MGKEEESVCPDAFCPVAGLTSSGHCNSSLFKTLLSIIIIDPGLFLYIHRVYDYVDDDDDNDDDDDHHHLMTWMDLSIATAPLPSICNPSYPDLYVCPLMGDDQSSAFGNSRCCETRKERGHPPRRLPPCVLRGLLGTVGKSDL
jgi:hypothetical protein